MIKFNDVEYHLYEVRGYDHFLCEDLKKFAWLNRVEFKFYENEEVLCFVNLFAVHDGCDNISAEGRTNLHELVFVELLIAFVVEVVDVQTGAVCGEASQFLGGNPRRKFAALQRRAEKQDVGFALADEIHDDLGVGHDGEGLQTGVLRKDHLVAAVLVEFPGAAGDFVAQQNSLKFDTQTVGQLPALGDQLQTHSGDFAAFLFDEDPDVSDSFRHKNYPRV